jgi:hypothetical protein
MVSWTPTSCPFAQPPAPPAFAAPAGGGAKSMPVVQARQKHSAAFLACLFTVMFLMTAVGVGALTYVAMRSQTGQPSTATSFGS